MNSRLDELQAALLRVKLGHLDEWNERRRKIAAVYLRHLEGSQCDVPEIPPWSEPAWHLFVVRSRHRDALSHHLADQGVATMIHYPIPPHLQPAYDDQGIRSGQLPISEAIHREVLSLPIWPQMELGAAEYVAGEVLRYRAQ
jgi:dTDP-4-amino-4,6-dideoxygalactose transaminase